MTAHAYANPYDRLSGTIDLPRIVAAGFEERHFEAGTATINYVVGPDNGRPLVLIPAQTGIWESYQRVLVPLSRTFRVFAVDVRGHGKSSWTPGAYTWNTIGSDMAALLADVVQTPAIISGNSSGGLIALWCGANVPDLVAGVVLEDAPVFSAEMPRFRDEDRFVYRGLQHLVAVLGDVEHRDIADYLRQTLPVSEIRQKRVPGWFVSFMSRRIAAFQARHPGMPVDLRWFPRTVRVLFKSLSMFDPDFARAFVDGRVYEGLDHADALTRLTRPLLVLHADWHRWDRHGLVGAMDDDDAARIMSIVPRALYKKIPANHVIHMFKPKAFVAAISEFAATLPAPRERGA